MWDKSFDLLLTSDGDFGGMETEGLPLKDCFREEEPAALCSFMNEDTALDEFPTSFLGLCTMRSCFSFLGDGLLRLLRQCSPQMAGHSVSP